MHALECLSTDQIFSHVDPEGVHRHFNTSAMTRAVLTRKVVPYTTVCELNADLIGHIERNHGIETHHLQSITDQGMNTPILLVNFVDGTSLLVDGNHRCVKRWQAGRKEVSAICFDPGQWEPYLVTDFDKIFTRAQVLDILTNPQRERA